MIFHQLAVDVDQPYFFRVGQPCGAHTLCQVSSWSRRLALPYAWFAVQVPTDYQDNKRMVALNRALQDVVFTGANAAAHYVRVLKIKEGETFEAKQFRLLKQTLLLCPSVSCIVHELSNDGDILTFFAQYHETGLRELAARGQF